MEKLIQTYRFLLDHKLTPSLLRRILKSIGNRSLTFLYSNRGKRFFEYKVKGVNNTFYLTADWMDYTDGRQVLEPLYEENVSNFLFKTLTPGDHFVNLGSNIGYFPLLVSSFNKDIKVASVEPAIRNYTYQKRSIEKNGFTNVILKKEAISDHIEPAGVLKSIYLNSGSGSIVDYLGATGDEFLVNSEPCAFNTLDNLLSELNINRIAVLMLDVQGAEFTILNSVKDKLNKDYALPHLIAEFVATPDDQKLYDLMTSLNYKLYKINDDGSLETIAFDQMKRKKSYLYKLVN